MLCEKAVENLSKLCAADRLATRTKTVVLKDGSTAQSLPFDDSLWNDMIAEPGTKMFEVQKDIVNTMEGSYDEQC